MRAWCKCSVRRPSPDLSSGDLYVAGLRPEQAVPAKQHQVVWTSDSSRTARRSGVQTLNEHLAVLGNLQLPASGC